MSRIGKLPIEIAKEVSVKAEENKLVISGPKGTLHVELPSRYKIQIENGFLTLNSLDQTSSLLGLYRMKIANGVVGVTRGWSKSLELSGVGYRANLEGETLVLTVGFSHPVKISPPAGITFTISEGKIVVSGCDRQQVGQIAANIREVKKPEPYKGKGIKYVGEIIRKKAGKSAKAVGAATGGAK